MAGKRNFVKAAEAGEAWNSARQLRALCSRIAQRAADRWHGSERAVRASALALGARRDHTKGAGLTAHCLGAGDGASTLSDEGAHGWWVR